mmetsp:Transcript_57936/g.142119  ORF Transcript_57936/g.142119 Transcript_57936/m.142119 type:complete len:327 (+) Transcript_57936:1931-2911(+)
MLTTLARILRRQQCITRSRDQYPFPISSAALFSKPRSATVEVIFSSPSIVRRISTKSVEKSFHLMASDEKYLRLSFTAFRRPPIILFTCEARSAPTAAFGAPSPKTSQSNIDLLSFSAIAAATTALPRPKSPSGSREPLPGAACKPAASAVVAAAAAAEVAASGDADADEASCTACDAPFGASASSSSLSSNCTSTGSFSLGSISQCVMPFRASASSERMRTIGIDGGSMSEAWSSVFSWPSASAAVTTITPLAPRSHSCRTCAGVDAASSTTATAPCRLPSSGPSASAHTSTPAADAFSDEHWTSTPISLKPASPCVALATRRMP